MKRRAVSGLVLMLLLTSMLSSAFIIQPVKAEGGTIYIRADGSIDPPIAPIQRVGDIYTFTDNIYDRIVIERDNIVVDGARHTLQGSGISGIVLSGRSNVTIKNMEIKNFYKGIYLGESSNNHIHGCIITATAWYGLELSNSFNNSIHGNNVIANKWHGIWLDNSSNNNIYGNNITANGRSGIISSPSTLSLSSTNIIFDNTVLANNEDGIFIKGSLNNIYGNNITANKWRGIFIHGSLNNIYGNNITKNENGIYLYSSANSYIYRNNITNNTGGSISLTFSNNSWIYKNEITVTRYSSGGIFFRGSSGNVISENNITSNYWYWYGFHLDSSSGNSIYGNNIKNSGEGMSLSSSNNNSISGNNIINNHRGVYLALSSANTFYHNNFINNTYGVWYVTTGYSNVWDDGFPSGGNYWSDYTGVDVNGDGIGDTPYIIDAYNRDRYPLMKPWTPTPPPVPQTFSDDFSSDTGLWEYSGLKYPPYWGEGAVYSAYRDASKEYVVLTPPEPHLAGVIWFKHNFNSPFTVSFSYLAGGGSGADGLVMMFYHEKPPYLWSGASLSFIGRGYGIEFDNYGNYLDDEYGGPLITDPSGNHIAIIKDNPSNHLVYVNDLRTEDNVWHDVKVTVDYSSITVFVDAEEVIHWEGGIDRTYGGFGFAGTTGGFTNWHLVDNFSITLHPVAPPPENRPPTCVIKLQKDGVKIDEIDVWEFFDIYVGGSTDDTGIKQIRFSSDNVQDGYPTGRWTEWYDWDVSSEDWNATNKIKRWAFATPGYKEVWAEVKDEIGQTAVGLAKIFVPALALPVITSPLVITPVKDIYNVRDSLEAEFTIKNIGDVPITLDVLTVGGRLNGFIPPEGAPDFTFQSVTLQPNEPYQYQGSLTLTQTGNYHFFIAYHIENPTPDEERLLDENNWNTCVELGEGLTHTDRVKNIIIVFEEGVVPEEVSLLRETIDRWKNYHLQYRYPPYLLDADSFTSAVATLWASFTSFITRTDLAKKYDELYFTGIEYQWLSFQALMDADRSLESGNVEGARRYLQRSYMYDRLSAMSFGAAAEVFDRNLEAGEILAKGIKDGCEAAVRVGVAIVYPPAAAKVDAIYMGIDFVVTAKVEGVDQATKDVITQLIAKWLLKDLKFTSLNDNTLEAYVNKVSTEVPLDTLLGNEEFMREFGLELRKVITDRVIDEVGVWISEELIEEIVKGVIDRLESFINSVQTKAKSPVELRVLDSRAQITGLMNKIVKHEIPMSLYYNGTVTIFFPSDTYRYEVVGTDEGTYGLEITSVRAGNVTVFTATDIPTSANAIHQYTVDWVALSQDEEGVVVQIDLDGDGVFEHTFTSDSELTQWEYVIGTDKIPPQTSLNIGEPKFVVNGVTYLTSATSIALTALDNPSGSGVASTAYRIYNAAYDSGWITYTQPFYLIGLSDGTYHIDFNSTDIAGNIELTNRVTVILDNTGPSVEVVNPPAGWALQDGVTFIISAIDASGTYSMNISIREADGGEGKPVGFEDLPATYNATTGKWTLFFDTLQLPDGYYIVLVKAKDNLGNIGSVIVPYSIRNWAVIELLPASETNKAGRTMPVKFALRVAASVDPNQPFVYNEELVIKIYATDNPSNILQISTFGDTARDYRINTVSEQYITNFQTLKTPKTYVVEVYRKGMLIGTFQFKTVK